MPIEITPEIAARLEKKKVAWRKDTEAKKEGQTLYRCYHCDHQEYSISRPKKCPKCGKVSHEKQRRRIIVRR